MTKLQSLTSRLKLYFSVPPMVPFRQFRNGIIYFAVGLGTVLMASNHLPPSVVQEAIVLAGLILGGLGFILAMSAQLRLLIGRLLRFYRRKL